MAHTITGRLLTVPVIAAVLVTALAGTSFLSPTATRVAQAQSEPATAANGIVLPPLDFDPVAARNESLVESAAMPATPTPAASEDGSTATEAPDTATDAPNAATDTPGSSNSVTTSLGGSDVAVSSVGGSYEVDRPGKRSGRKQ